MLMFGVSGVVFSEVAAREGWRGVECVCASGKDDGGGKLAQAREDAAKALSKTP
jgi:hypothetical protein